MRASTRVCLLVCLLAVSALCSAPLVHADEAVAAGRIKADQVCSNCHGLDGQAASGGNSALSPTLTAQSREYLKSRLLDYRRGEREHPQMTLIARMISEQDIDNVAAWYASLKIGLSGNLGAADDSLAPGARAGKVKADLLCKHCHGLDGQAVAGPMLVPSLSGQPRPYIVDRLEAYRSGRIEHPLMTPIAMGLADDDIANVADWYSGIRVDVLDFE